MLGLLPFSRPLPGDSNAGMHELLVTELSFTPDNFQRSPRSRTTAPSDLRCLFGWQESLGDPSDVLTHALSA